MSGGVGRGGGSEIVDKPDSLHSSTDVKVLLLLLSLSSLLLVLVMLLLLYFQYY